MIALLFAAGLAAASPNCARSTAQLETAIEDRAITPSQVEALIRIGRLRQKSGVAVVPMSFLCPSIDDAARELMRGPRTRAALAREHLSARQYAVTAMALWKISEDVRAGREPASPRGRHARELYLAHRSALDALIYER